jgi:uridine kinase
VTFEQLHKSVIEARERAARDRACFVGVSGIDASGKGHVAARLATELEAAGYRVALINVDGWLNLPHIRFADADPGEHFYRHALRLDEMFERLVLPLNRDRSIDLTMDFTEETATEFRPHKYLFEDVEIILLEGIFIFKRNFSSYFDLKIWIECGFDTALERAIARGQENLPSDATIAAYESIYFPAQRIHFEIDDPSSAADVIFPNE